MSMFEQAAADIVTSLRGTTPDDVHTGMHVAVSDVEATAVATLFGAVADFIETLVPEGYDGAACIGGVLAGLSGVGQSVHLAAAIDSGDPEIVAAALSHADLGSMLGGE